MRTQLILTTAVLGVAGSLGASAQVYSVNAVGYINVSVPAGKLALVANQLNAGGNKISEVLAPSGDVTVYTYAAGAFTLNAFSFGEWANPNQVVGPGTAFFIKNEGATDMTLTFVGEVPTGTLTTALGANLNLTASQVPQAGKLVTDLGFPVAEDDTVYKWDIAGQTYTLNAYSFGEWGAGEPTVGVGEGFWVQKTAAASWTRTFSVN
jgi:hypothetical protein